jgi:hypothetical protein
VASSIVACDVATGAASCAPTEDSSQLHLIIEGRNGATELISERRGPCRDVGFCLMIHSLPKPFGSDGVETCCLIIEGRETHHSLARDFHTAAFALRLVVTAFTNREGDLSRRNCVAASDQNFKRFVTPYHVCVNTRSTETLARQRGSDGLRYDMCLRPLRTAKPRKIQCDQLWSSFPGMPKISAMPE